MKLVVKSQMQNITKHTNKNRTKADQKLVPGHKVK